MVDGYWPYISIIICLTLSAFFSGSEIAFASANKFRLKKHAENGSLRGRASYYISENYNSALSAILIGNNLVNIATSSVATIIAISLVGESGVAYATIVTTIIILIFGEIVPKIVAKKHCDSVSLFVSLPLRMIMIILSPVVYIVVGIVNALSKLWEKKLNKIPTITEDELVAVIEVGEDEGVIDEEKSELLQSSIEFSDISIEEITTHRVNMIAIDINDDPLESYKALENASYTRIPVYEDNIDNIIGILSVNHYLKKIVDDDEIDVRSILMEPLFIHKTVRLPAALAEMRRLKKYMAIVIDEYGGTMGLVTLEDILEQLVGDIWDETDEIQKDLTSIGVNTYEVNGEMSLCDFFDTIGINSKKIESEYVTVGGWVIELLGGFPHLNDKIHYENINIQVKEIEDHCVTKLTVKVMEPKEIETIS